MSRTGLLWSGAGVAFIGILTVAGVRAGPSGASMAIRSVSPQTTDPALSAWQLPADAGAVSDLDKVNLRAGIVPLALLGQGIEWCNTQRKWEAKGLGGVAGGPACLTQGTCDVPAVRDSWIPGSSTPVLSLNIHFNVFANNDGSNPAATQADVDAQVATLNSDFAPSKIQFCATTTFINDSAYRSFADAEEFAMKSSYANNASTKLNVYVVNIEGGYLGVGTFPWDPDALTNLGGIIIEDDYFGAGQGTLTHEVGHCIGLWHTHHGVSEVPQCSACWERADGLDGDTTGDFASDTAPTPVNLRLCPPGRH